MRIFEILAGIAVGYCLFWAIIGLLWVLVWGLIFLSFGISDLLGL